MRELKLPYNNAKEEDEEGFSPDYEGIDVILEGKASCNRRKVFLPTMRELTLFFVYQLHLQGQGFLPTMRELK